MAVAFNSIDRSFGFPYVEKKSFSIEVIITSFEQAHAAQPERCKGIVSPHRERAVQPVAGTGR